MDILGYFRKYNSLQHYAQENWDGWPLHSLIAGAFMVGAMFSPMETMLIANTIWWPDREATQHEGYANIWSFHRILEWGSPLVVGFVIYGYWKFFL